MASFCILSILAFQFGQFCLRVHGGRIAVGANFVTGAGVARRTGVTGGSRGKALRRLSMCSLALDQRPHPGRRSNHDLISCTPAGLARL